MNREAVSEMLHSLSSSGQFISGGGGDMTVLERQRARMRFVEEQLRQPPLPPQPPPQYVVNADDHQMNMFSLQGLITGDQGLHELVNRAMKTEPLIGNGWSCDYGGTDGGGGLSYNGSSGYGILPGFGNNCPISRTASCPPAVAATLAEVAVAANKGNETVSAEKWNSTAGKESFKKRKAEKPPNPKVVEEEKSKDKKMKGCPAEGDSKVTEETSNKSTDNNNSKQESGDTSKEKSKVTEPPKQDYIHVRARRGQATDSHSLAERVRREKISERMKYLQDLVPGCNKIIGKAGMLDEIINYVQSLQRQVEFLSMKLAAVNPQLDIKIDNILDKEMFQTCTASFPTMGVSCDMTNSSTVQFNSLQQMVSGGFEIGVNPASDVALRRTISAPITVPETLLEAPCFNQIQAPSTWEAEIPNLYGMEFHQGRPAPFLPQQFTGFLENGNVKMEM